MINSNDINDDSNDETNELNFYDSYDKYLFSYEVNPFFRYDVSK